MKTLITLLLSTHCATCIGGGTPAAAPPVSFVASLSLAGDAASPPMLLYVYRCAPSSDERPRPTATEVLPIVREAILSADWQADGAYLKAVNNRLIVRHRADVQRQVLELLVEIGAVDPPPRVGRGGGFGCGSVIPIVGSRGRDAAPR